MKMKLLYILLAGLLFGQISESENEGTNIGIDIPSGIKIELSGEAEVEFVNVEGKGGAKYNSQNNDGFLKKIDQRSPYMQVDKTVLDFKLLYTDNLTYSLSARFDDDGAYADKNYLKYIRNNTTIELGKSQPKIALRKNTEGYPLIGTSYWKGRQYHLDLEHSFSSFNLGASLALKRPIGLDAAAEDDSFGMIVYTNGKKIDGQTVELGFRGDYTYGPLNLAGWYYFGKLIDDADWKKTLHYDFDYYTLIESNTTLSDSAYVGHFWFGGRAQVSVLNVLLRSEYIFSEDGYLPRDGFYFEASTKSLPLLDGLFFLVRYGQLRIDPYRMTDSFLNPYRNSHESSFLEPEDLNGDGLINENAYPTSENEDKRFYPVLKDPETWNRELITIAFSYNLTDYAQLRFEYYFLNEETGDTEEVAELRDRPYQPNVKDDQLLFQLRLSF